MEQQATEQLAMFSKDELLGFFKAGTVERTIGGRKVLFRELSAPEVSDIRKACKANDSTDDFGFHLVIASLVDEGGNLVFTKDDLPALRAGAQGRIGQFVEAVMDVNGFVVTKAADEAGQKN